MAAMHLNNYFYLSAPRKSAALTTEKCQCCIAHEVLKQHMLNYCSFLNSATNDMHIYIYIF